MVNGTPLSFVAKMILVFEKVLSHDCQTDADQISKFLIIFLFIILKCKCPLSFVPDTGV